MEIFAGIIALIGVGVMVRAIRIQAAFMLIGVVSLAFVLWPNAGSYAEYVPTWVFWGVVVVIGISLLQTVLGVLFGRRVADSFVGNLLTAILNPIISLLGGLIRAVFRIR